MAEKMVTNACSILSTMHLQKIYPLWSINSYQQNVSDFMNKINIDLFIKKSNLFKVVKKVIEKIVVL